MNLDAECLDVVCTISTAGEVGQVELDLVPAFVETHGHRADEGLDAGGGLVVGGAEAAAKALVVEDGDFEGEVLLEVLDDHDEEGELDAQSLLGVGRAGDVAGVDVATDEFEDGRVDVLVGETLNVAVTNFLFPNLERTGSDGVEN